MVSRSGRKWFRRGGDKANGGYSDGTELYSLPEKAQVETGNVGLRLRLGREVNSPARSAERPAFAGSVRTVMDGRSEKQNSRRPFCGVGMG